LRRASRHGAVQHVLQRDRGKEELDLPAQFLPEIVRVACIDSSTAAMMSAIATARAGRASR